MSDDLIGVDLDGFVIDGVLGRGGMGVVYSAEEVALHRQVAIKILPDNLAKNDAFLTRFLREARAVAQLNHPHVVTIYRVGQAEGYHYIAMEYIKGGELKALIEEEGQLSLMKTVDCMRQSASALDAAHALGILHRDIKPQNIMLDERGRVKVMDFGIAKMLSADEGGASLTMDGTLLGTPTHMAPEVCGGEAIDHRADIYALGIVLFQCLTGELPMKGETPLVIIQKVLNEDLPDVDSFREDVPASLVAVLKKATAKELKNRYASARNFEEDLAACQRVLESGGGDETLVRKIAFGESRTSKGPVLAVALGLLTLVGGMAYFLREKPGVEMEGSVVGQPVALLSNEESVVSEGSGAVAMSEVALRVGGVLPETPQGFKVSQVGLRKLVLTWLPAVDDPDTFQVERARDKEGPWISLDRVSPSDLKYVDEGGNGGALGDDASYYYRLFAVSEEGVKSEVSLLLEGVTAPPPAAPAALGLATPSSRCVMIEWPASIGEGVVLYRLERAEAGDDPAYRFLAETKKTFYKDGGTATTDLKDSTKYLYRVQAVNRVAAEGSMSSSVEVMTLPPPDRVVGLKARGDEVRCIPVSWEAHLDEDIVAYTLYRSDTEDGEYAVLATFKKGGALAYLDGAKNPGSLDDEQGYYYKIVAENNVGARSLYSDAVSAVTRSVPPSVVGFSGDVDAAREVPLRWVVSEDEKVVGYRIWRQGPGEGGFEQIEELDSREVTSYVDRGRGAKGSDALGRLLDGAVYRYKIQAFNTAVALSPFSEVLRLKTKDAPVRSVLLAPTRSEVKQVRLSWAANPEEDIVSYELQVSSSLVKSFKRLAVVEAGGEGSFEYIDTGLADGAVRYYRLQALDASGLTSAWVDALEGQAKARPLAPTELFVASRKMGLVEIEWVSSVTEDVVEYRVFQKSGFTFKWTDLGVSRTASYKIPAEDVGKKSVFSVISVDADGLESERSEVLEVLAE